MGQTEFGWLIMSVNTAIIFFLLKTTIFCARKCYLNDITDYDYNFYMILFLMGSTLLIANINAWYTGYMLYFDPIHVVADEVSWARYVDRFCMLMAYIGFDLLSLKYIKAWFHRP